MLDSSRLALKEWVIVTRKLGEGRQIVVFRKGGLREHRAGFAIRHPEFFLFPTYFHQTKPDLIEEAQEELDALLAAAPPSDQVRLELYAIVEDVFEVKDTDRLRGLNGLHVLTEAAVERRFTYRQPGLHVLALRVLRLPRPVTLPNLPRYEGCTSWVQLGEDISTVGASPVLTDAAFARALTGIRQILL